MTTRSPTRSTPGTAPSVLQRRPLFPTRPFAPPGALVGPAPQEEPAPGTPAAGYHFADIPVRRAQNPLPAPVVPHATPGAADRVAPGPAPVAAMAAPPNHTGLPERLKAGIETLSGLALDAVRVHYQSTKPAQLQALAYTQGTDIYVAPGQEQHLPHEAWHVVQQAQGRVQPTRQMKDGVSVNDAQGLENEAEVMGTRAATTQATRPSAGESGSGTSHHTHRARQGDQGLQLQDAGARQMVQCYRIVGTPKYGTGGANRAGTSTLTIRMDGTIGRLGANEPTNRMKGQMRGRGNIREAYQMKTDKEPYAMHLVNGRLGGSGDNWENLAWGTHNFNARHTREWELDRQADAQNNRSGIMQMAVTAHYKSDSRFQRSDYYFLDSLTCKHRIYDDQWNEIDPWTTVIVRDGQSPEEADPSWSEGDESFEGDM